MRLLPLACVAVLGLLRTSAADACEITNVAPTGVIPTTPSQPFSFVATNDCTMLSFSAQDGDIVKTPRPGMVMGGDRRRYTVSLTLADWNTVASSDAATFQWIASGRTSGTPARVMTENELDFDADGWTRSEGDVGECDLSADRNPGVTEIVGNLIDDDCDGQVDALLVEPDATITSDLRHGYFGWALAAGDTDGDGVADLVVGNPANHLTKGAVYLVHGPVEGTVDAADETTLTWGSTTGRSSPAFGMQVDAGDANGDGLDDVLVGASAVNAGYLFLGPITANGSASDADVVLMGSDGTYLGEDVDIVDDFSGDGVADLVIGGSGAPRYGSVYVASGTLSGTASLNSTSRSSATYAFYFNLDLTDSVGMHETALGDATGDGITDLVMSTPHETRDPKIYLIEGGLPSGNYDVESAAWATVDTFLDATNVGPGLAGGDYDGDGTVDLVMGRVQDLGYVHAFLGPVSGALTPTDATTTWETNEPFADLGTAVAVADFDADDQLDVLMGHDRIGTVAYVQLGWAEGSIDVATLPSFAPPITGFNGVLTSIPDWSGDGGAEIAIATPFTDPYWEGAVHVYLSDRL